MPNSNDVTIPAVPAQLVGNLEPPALALVEPGVVEVKLTDEDELVIDFRPSADADAAVSAYMDRASAMGLAAVLREVATTNRRPLDVWFRFLEQFASVQAEGKRSF